MPIYKDILTKQTKKTKTLQQSQLQQLKRNEIQHLCEHTRQFVCCKMDISFSHFGIFKLSIEMSL